MGGNPLRVAVVSDLHFVNNEAVIDGDRASWLVFSENDGLSKNNFWSSLLDKIERENIKADLLVCPGDITTHSEISALNFAWSKLNELAIKLGCSVLVTATGNHDVQSRLNVHSKNTIRELNNNNDLFENLKQLKPPYPLVDLSTFDESSAHLRRVHYFGTDFLLFDSNPDYRLVVFNSCARHTSSPNDYERGYLANSTLQWLEDAVKSVYDHKNKKPSIFVCHHHPIQHDELGTGSYDFIKGGNKLIEMLSNYGSWIVIHGHKHHAKLTYHSVGSKKTVVFAAGTLSAHKQSLGNNFTNQFYIIDINKEKTKGTLEGYFNVYSWKGSQWSLTKSKNEGVFTGIGFGDIGCLEDLADAIAKEVYSVNRLQWNVVVEKLPQLKKCLPKDLELLSIYLQDEHNIDISMNEQFEYDYLDRAKI
ncbi:metallophosphoesterase family protein [Shewanella acanthi]|uniref:metallophosphoesterase family protein n=1 Tax=Shewanella acanthi TaxID=2864212 RepID=UPI001C657832|nr:metallophosphoesterase [Shewanella acanthi]QYJ78333.1 metallophosphoesterase [Shewanella acanthi]